MASKDIDIADELRYAQQDVRRERITAGMGGGCHMTRYVLWASDHDAWWAPREQGYTSQVTLAGRYTLGEVAMILDRDSLGEQIVMTVENAARHGRPNAAGAK